MKKNQDWKYVELSNSQLLASVDPADFPRVNKFTWYAHEGHNGILYARTHVGPGQRRSSLYMHQLIMGHPYIDHWNHVGLDNRRCNLRPATNTQNQQGRRKCFGFYSDYKGVTIDWRTGKYRASIRINGRPKFLGTFYVEKEAAVAYDAAAYTHFGKYGCFNFLNFAPLPPKETYAQ